MAQYCQNCGTALSEGTSFCPACGSPVAQLLRQPPAPGPTAPGNYQPRNGPGFPSGLPAPGYSQRVNEPEILAAVQKNKRATRLFALFFVPLPLIGFVVYSLVSESMELRQGLLYGGIVSAVFLLFALIGMLKSRAANSYEAVVLEQKQRERSDTRNDSTNEYTEYITVVETAEGRKKKIVETSRGMVVAYHYLKVGDRFRYHPQFSFPYELYDKSAAPYIACVACGTHNSVTDDRCRQCHIPLLK